MKILILTDSPRWSSWITCKNIEAHIASEFDVDVEARGQLIYHPGDEEYDVVYVHCNFSVESANIQVYRMLNRDSRIIAGVRGWLGFKRTKDFLHLYDAVNADNLRLLEAVKQHSKDVFLCHAGVDTELFKPFDVDRPEEFRIGWAGNEGQWVKNVDILPKLGHPYVIAGKRRRNRIKHKDMPAFYNSLDVYVHLSSMGVLVGEDAEGCPLPVLEAAACGRAILATETSGAARELLCDCQIVKGDIRRGAGLAMMRKKLNEFRANPELRAELGFKNRAIAVNEWDWSVKVHQYETFFRDGGK